MNYEHIQRILPKYQVIVTLFTNSFCYHTEKIAVASKALI